MQPYRYDEQEKEISFEVKEPCPSQRGSRSVGSGSGSETKGESMVKGIYADEKSTAEICAVAAYYPGSHAEESESQTSVVVEVETVNAMMDGGGAERLAEAWHGEPGFYCASHDASCPPHAFSGDPSPVFLAPIFPFVLQDACVPHPVVARVLPFLSSVFVGAPPASLC